MRCEPTRERTCELHLCGPEGSKAQQLRQRDAQPCDHRHHNGSTGNCQQHLRGQPQGHVKSAGQLGFNVQLPVLQQVHSRRRCAAWRKYSKWGSVL